MKANSERKVNSKPCELRKLSERRSREEKKGKEKNGKKGRDQHSKAIQNFHVC